MLKWDGMVVITIMACSNCVLIEDADHDETGIFNQEVAIAEYIASNTNYATNSATTAQIPVSLGTGETIMLGTLGITGSKFSGDTVLRLRNASLVDLAINDDSCNTTGSKLSFTSPSAATYTIWAGCFANSSCGNSLNHNIVAISRLRGISSFSVSNTNSASVNTINNQFFLNAGETIRTSTCDVDATGASAAGDTYLRLFAINHGVFTQVAFSDDIISACGNCGRSSTVIFTASLTGLYEVRTGCFANTSCSGTVVGYVE